MPASGHEQEDPNAALKELSGEDDLRTAANGAPTEGAARDDAGASPESPDAPAPQDGAVEIDERRAKMERLRAEGIDPYPPVSLPDRTLIADVLAAGDPSALQAGGD